MLKQWTFGKKVGAALGLGAALTLLVGVVSITALQGVSESKDQVIRINSQHLLDAEHLNTILERRGGQLRAYLITHKEGLLEEYRSTQADFTQVLKELRADKPTPEVEKTFQRLEVLDDTYDRGAQEVFELARSGAGTERASHVFETKVFPVRMEIDALLADIVRQEKSLMESEWKASKDKAKTAAGTLAVFILLAVAFALTASLMLARALGGQIGSAVGQVQSSAAELKAAANQQASGSREQATAMGEIITTIRELLATSRQIAENAKRVAQIADDSARSAREGAGTVQQSRESVETIRNQVEVIVGHMLDLGKKSQQIGSILDIVSELAEQTNILAINATIESSGAGEAGKRFGVVADEIRKLADRMAGSTKDVRGLIEDVRSAVNTTIMATESGSKSVEIGARQFGEVSAALLRIAAQVATASEAASEIELTTKQQSTAVEQVNQAVLGTSQATQEAEASAAQVLKTVSQLAALSNDLLSLVRSPAA